MTQSRPCPEGPLQRITAKPAQIGGGITVSRLLPTVARRMVGAWCFLDHAGPAVFKTGEGLKVGPHPHIGLQTFTWMLEGQVLHRDSLGYEQIVRPGQVNLMTAGAGISHTEESLPDEHELHAVQLWIALPEAHKNIAPAFDHYPILPKWQDQGMELTLLAGSYAGKTAPTQIYSKLLGVDLYAQEASRKTFTLAEDFEHCLLIVSGEWQINGETYSENELAYIGVGAQAITIEATRGARAVLLGGEPYPSEIVLWWNFVGHSREEIAKAQYDWEQQSPRFGEVKGFDGPRLVAPALPWRMA